MTRRIAPACRRAYLTALACAACASWSLASPAVAAATTTPPASAEYRAMIQADWAAQEKRLGRSVDSLQAVREALRRAALLAGSLPAAGTAAASPALDACRAELKSLQAAAGDLASMGPAAREGLYARTRWLVRRMALSHPLLAGRPIVFMKRRRFVCQMLHEYCGYWYGKIAGGGLFVLDRPGESLDVRDLTAGRLGEGAFTTLALSFDARTAYFAFVPRDGKPAEYRRADWMDFACAAGRRPVSGDGARWRCFHLHAVDIPTGRIRQLTDGPNDDFDPCPLPDGDLAFMSTRRGGYTRCNNDWEPLPVYTLHRLGGDGRTVRPLSFHETNEWHPSVLNDGRIVYTRWDYVDRSAANFHGIWVTNPDGTNAASVFGNYTRQINACFQPRAIPGSGKLAFLAGAHHADVGGSLMVLDPDRARLDGRSGEDDLGAVQSLTPWICYPEGVGWPDTYVHSPWPLSEDHFLVAYSHQPLPGMSARSKDDVPTGLYYLDRFGNLELLYRQEGISCMYPIPLAPRPVPPAIPADAGDAQARAADEGEFVLSDVGRGLFALPAGRAVRRIRVFQVLPKTWTHTNNTPRIGHANAESARVLLGEVPVEADGSARFRAPARRALYFQAVDGDGKAVQTMRSVTYLQPGERRGCVGCHEPRASAPAGGHLAARGREARRIVPGPDGTMPFCYPRLVQPILDRHCLRCHDGKAGTADGQAAGEGGKPAKARPVFTGESAGEFSRSYASLRPFLRWYEWGGASIRPNVTLPGACGADASPLTAILQAHRRTGRVKLSDEELRALYAWLDGNVPFYGVYADEPRHAQRRGEAVPVPAIQ